MRSCLGVSDLLVAEEGSRQHFGQLPILVPATVVTECEPIEFNQVCERLLENRFQCLDVGPSILIDLITGQA
ncbi:hypothetical protein D3C72_2195120 [compost metagenome]